MRIGSHLRDWHGYSLAESVRRAPAEMWGVHDTEHESEGCNHRHDGSGEVVCLGGPV